MDAWKAMWIMRIVLSQRDCVKISTEMQKFLQYFGRNFTGVENQIAEGLCGFFIFRFDHLDVFQKASICLCCIKWINVWDCLLNTRIFDLFIIPGTKLHIGCHWKMSLKILKITQKFKKNYQIENEKNEISDSITLRCIAIM